MTQFMIWSNQRGAWWRPFRRGYTTIIEWAGVYSEAEAQEIIAQSGIGAQTTARDDIGAHPDQVVPNEVVVPIEGRG